MGYTPPKKKKNLWDQITEGIGTAVRNVQKGADAVIPGDQSSWYKEPAPERQVQRPTQIRIEQPKPQVIASFRNEQPESIASFEKDQTQGLQFDTKDNNSLKLQNALNGGNLQIKQPEVNTQRLTVASAPANANINVVQDKRIQAIDKGLDQGKSWENISKETGLDLNMVKNRSQTTRPNYGKATTNYTSYDQTKADPIQDSTDGLSQAWDKMNDYDKDQYKAKLEELMLQGNGAAYNSFYELERQGKFKWELGREAGKLGRKFAGGMQTAGANVADVALMGGEAIGQFSNDISGLTAREEAAKQKFNDENIKRIGEIGKLLKGNITPDQRAALRLELSQRANAQAPKTSNERSMELTEKARDWFKQHENITGEKLNAKEDFQWTGDTERDYATLAGRGLETGVDATMFINPVSNFVKEPFKQTAKQVGKDVFKRSVAQAIPDFASAGLSTYGATGDVGESLKNATISGATTFATQGVLETGGHTFGRMNPSTSAVNKGAGYSADDIASEDFSDFVRLAHSGRIAEVPESVRGIVSKYTGEVAKALDETNTPGVVNINNQTLYRGGDLNRTTYDDRGAGYFFSPDQTVASNYGRPAVYQSGNLRLVDIDTPEGMKIYNSVRSRYNANPVGDEVTKIAEAVAKDLRQMGYDGYRGNKAGDDMGVEYNIFDDLNFKKNGLDVVTEKVTPTVQNKRAIDANEHLQRLRERAANPITENPVRVLSTKYGVKEDTVERLIRDYGEERARGVLSYMDEARASGMTPGNKPIATPDGFVIAHAKKLFGGKARVTGAPDRVPQVATEAEERLIANKLADEQRVQDYRDQNSYLSDAEERQLAGQIDAPSTATVTGVPTITTPQPKPEVPKSTDRIFTTEAGDSISDMPTEIIKTDGGYIRILPNSPYAPENLTSIVKVMVDEGSRRQGIGSDLLKQAMNKYGRLSAFAENEASVRMNYKLGMRPVDNPTATLAETLELSKPQNGALTMITPKAPQPKPEASTTATVTGVPTIDTPQGRVNTESGEILDEFTVNLNDAVARAGKEIESINAEVRSLGFDPNDIRRKMTAANRGEYQMTPDEMNAASLYTNRLDQARGSLEEAGVQIEGQQQFYTPQVKGESFLPSSREDLSDFGYKERRTNAYELDEINYGDNPQIDYIVKAENRDLLVQKATNDAAIIDGRSVSPDGVRQAAADTLELQKKIKDKSNSEGVLTNDTLADLYTIGKNEGYTQVDNNYNPGMIVQEPKAMLEQAGIYKNGFEQFDNSVGYANEFVDVLKQNNVPPNQVAAALEQSIRGRMPDADQSSVSAAVEYAMKAMSRNGVEAVNAASIFERAFKNVAKSELFRVGKTTRFSSTKMNKVVNEQINDRILPDAYKKNAVREFDRFLSERINASLRGLNIVSALFELGDVANIFAKFGVKDMKNAKFGFGKVDGERFALTKKYGQTNSHFASNDIPDVSKLDTIWANENTNLAKKVYDSYRAVENKFLFFRYIEEIKTEMYFRSAENFYKSPQGGGLQGGALVDRVMEDFHKTMLPHKLATANRIVGKMPSTITQYLNWSLQATKRMGRTISGSDTGGKFANMTRGERVARGIGAEIVPKVAVATLAGVPIMQVLGMRDFTNATSGDFTGIEDEDKNVMDTVVQTLSISPAVGVAGNFYFANRRNQIADERAANGESYGSERRVEDQPLNVAAESAKMLIPFHTQAKKSSQVLEAHNKGYYENRDGRIQAEGPNGAELAMGLVTGKGYTPTMREYQDAPDVVSVIKGKANVGDLITKNQSVANVVQALGGDSTREYNRPLTDDYSDKFKAIEGEARTELLKGGRQYNSYLDNLKRTNEDAYNNYISSMDGNHVNPEYWREITKDPETFQMVKNRKLQLYKDLGTEYDPIYDLPDDQASVVLKYKSAPTGDDMALRNILNKEQWYKDYKDRVTAFYDKKGEQTESDFDSTARVKEWEALDDKLSSFYYDKEAKEAPAWAKDFPLVFQQKAINDKFGFDSPESKTFFKGNADAYQAQKEGYDKAQLEVINAMRVIEGVPPMSWEAYQQATEIADTDTSDDKDWKKYGKGGNGGGNGVDAGGATFGQKRGTGLDKVTVKVPKIAVKRKGGVPGKVTVKKGGKLL